jgi:hypothetical protein
MVARVDTRRDSEVSAELHPFDVRTVQVAEELIDLWDEVPLDSEKIAKVAPTTLLFMPQGMIELLRLIEHASYDRDIAALSAALGFRGKGDRNVAQRLSDFAVEHEREEGRTTRRWAHNGAYKLAELIVRAIDEPPELTITFEQVAEEPVRFAITVEREEPESNINPLLTLEASVYGAALDAMWSRFFSGEELEVTSGRVVYGSR